MRNPRLARHVVARNGGFGSPGLGTYTFAPVEGTGRSETMSGMGGRGLIGRLFAKMRRVVRTEDDERIAGELTRPRLAAEPWFIDSREPVPDSGLIRLTGWAFPDPDVPAARWASRFTVNDAAPVSVEYPIARPDIGQAFWQREDAASSGFVILARPGYRDGIMKVSCSDSACDRFDRGRQDWHLPDPALHVDLPDPDRRYRVIGNRDPEGFLVLGATDANRIRAAYEAVTGRGWSELGAVLDWGVGCGRIARHLAPGLGERFFGCDIDADNVAWCSGHLPGTYRPSRLEPPLPFADASFDAVYGVSVFTHLRAQWEARWLEELHRVLRPGGTLLATVHGQTAIDFARLEPAVYRALQLRVEHEGLAVTSSNDQLDGFVEHPEEYLNVFHSRAHVQREWGRWFRDIRQLGGYLFTHDLVVATRK